MATSQLVPLILGLSALMTFNALRASGADDERAEGTQVNLTTAAMHGSDMSAQDAAETEALVKRDPEDVVARARLLGYYMMQQYKSPATRELRRQHVLWMIENRPADAFLRRAYCSVDRIIDPETFQQATQLWEKQVTAHADDADVLGNAANFHLLSEPGRAESLYIKAAALEPENPDWPKSLAHLYSLQRRGAAPAEQLALAEKALQQQKRAMELATEPANRFYHLTYLPEFALNAGNMEEATAFATKLLDSAKDFPRDWNYGNAVHKANLALGHVALSKGDVAAAKEYLLAAGRTPGSPQLGSFGPNMTLAKALLERGERDVVIDYLKLCGKFWGMGNKRLKTWTETVQAGGTPDFGANESY